MSQAFKAVTFYQQQFTAPGCAVDTSAVAIQSDSQHRLIIAVLSEYCADVGMVVLDTHQGQIHGFTEMFCQSG